MDKLWAPWRKGYILKKSHRGCFFCQKIKAPASRDSKNLILKRTPHSFSVLNLYPYNNGHLMVVPKKHVATLDRLTETEQLDLLKLVNDTVKLLKRSLNPRGMNLGINMGRIGGAGVPGHIHIHLVPRWAGDTNFMPVTGNTKVISESLKSVYERLKKRIKK